MTEQASDHRAQSLFVSWRDPSGSIHPVGRLVRRAEPDGETYSFAYLKVAATLKGFEPLPGLPDLHARYDSSRLFPVFANRVMPRTRPDFDALTRNLALDGPVDPFEILTRSGGRRATDRIEVFAGPERTPSGQSDVTFFVRGIRHLEGAAALVNALATGDRLTLLPEPQNEHNTRALLLCVVDGRRVGWVPDYLVEHAHDLREMNGEDPVVLVEHVNAEDVPPHLRLLCRLQAPWPRGHEPFSGPEFQTFVDLG